jgi:hypothetical protein
MPDLTDLSATVVPTVSVNSIDLLPTVQPKLKRTIVDTRLHLPDMFELTFEDSTTRWSRTDGAHRQPGRGATAARRDHRRPSA